jgi:restriction system protein
MTTKARLETTRGGNQPRYINRTYWVASYFRKAGLVETSKRGYVKITKRGKEFLKKHRGQISSDDLNSFSSFTSFKERKTAAEVQKASDNGILNHSLTPHDRINDALQEIEDELAQMILEQLQSASPSFFERAVLDLFLNMGYGSSNEEAGELLGGSGDNGVDGLINQDALGLERVYIQAKRYQSENNISADAITGI